MNNKDLARIMGREEVDIEDCRLWILNCRCPYSGGRLHPQPDCTRDKNARAHGINEGISPWAAIIRKHFEGEASVGPTPPRARPPEFGKLPTLSPELVAYIQSVPRDVEPFGWSRGSLRTNDQSEASRSRITGRSPCGK